MNITNRKFSRLLRGQILLSEDMHDGFTWGGATVVNPFAEKPNPLLAALLEPPAS